MLVTLNNENKPTTNSRIIAKEFGMLHANVMRAIQNLECSPEFSVINFQHRDFTNIRKQTFKEYVLTEKGALFLILGFTGAKAAGVKERFIEAFDAMAKKLAKQTSDVEWKTARIQGKAARQEMTDKVQVFVEYAKAQGSQSAEKYYMAITKMEYRALDLVEMGANNVGGNFRDTLDRLQISCLCLAEDIAGKSLELGMVQKLHYKDIYQLAKHNVTKFAETASMLLPAPSTNLPKE